MWFIFLFAMQADMKVEHGRATIYWPNDGYCGKRKANGTAFRQTDSHIAHRRLPINTRGTVCNLRTKRCTRTIVKDRGPFGALLPCYRAKKGSKSLRPHRWNGKTFKVKKIHWRKVCYWYMPQPGKLRTGWRYRGEFDLTKPVGEAIKHRQFDKVVFVYSTSKRYAFNDRSNN